MAAKGYDDDDDDDDGLTEEDTVKCTTT